MSVEPQAAGTGGSPRGDWVVPLIVLVVALAIVAVLVFAGLSLLGGTAEEALSPSSAPSEAVASASAVTPTVSEAAASPTDAAEETSVFDLEAGDCFSAESDQLGTVLVVDCAQPHEYEAFHVFDHPAGGDEPYPTDDVLFDYADTECQPPFEEFVGHDYQTSIWYITSLTPSEGTWADGDREIVCTLNQQDEDAEPITVTGSAEGSAQ